MQVNPHAPGLHDILSGAWGQVARWYFAFALAALVIGLVIAGEGVVG